MLNQNVNNRDLGLRSPTDERTNMNNKFDVLTKNVAQAVTRRAALKKFAAGLVGLALAGLLALPVIADGVEPAVAQSNPDPQHIVFNNSLGGYEVRGAANPALDPRNLQWAIDRSDGGAVFLRQTFDLGMSTVFITKNVKIMAAPGASPVIKNGGDPTAGHDSPNQAAFYVGWNGQTLLAPPAHGLYGSQEHPRFPGVVEYFPAFPVQFAIRGLHFQDSVRSAIMVGACTGATIEGNTFTNIKWGYWDQWYLPGPTFRSLAICFSGAVCWPYLGLTSTSAVDAASLASASRSVSGPLRIRSNTINLVGLSAQPPGFDPGTAESNGILAGPGTAADLAVENNQINHIAINATGINILFNIGPRSLVANNVVGDVDSNGIFGWAYLFNCTFTFTGNAVTVGGANSAASGIVIEGDTFNPQTGFSFVPSDATAIASVISGNTITMNGSQSGAITLYDHCVQTRVVQNTITGSAAWAVGTFILDPSETAEQNTIANNAIAPSFQADVANILLTSGVTRCAVSRNIIGGGGTAGVFCQGDHNVIVANDYSQSGYLGFASGAGCVLLDAGTVGNFVAETKFPAGTDVCGQVLDLGTNTVLGAGSCK
jgi:hypothetical protein